MDSVVPPCASQVMSLLLSDKGGAARELPASAPGSKRSFEATVNMVCWS